MYTQLRVYHSHMVSMEKLFIRRVAGIADDSQNAHPVFARIFVAAPTNGPQAHIFADKNTA